MTHPTSIDDTKLSSNVTIAQYREFECDQNREAIAAIILQRFTERYIIPLRCDPRRKHGFSLMAISCLMIEALQSFYEGWEDSEGPGRKVFEKFFKANPKFALFEPYAYSFYKGVRCGILHQAETTRGWHILRRGVLFDPVTLTINATSFHNALAGCLKQYCDKLETEPWDSELWKLCRKKLDSICQNCEYVQSALYFAYGSNMDTAHFQERIPSAQPYRIGSLEGWELICNKPSKDGSSKANLIRHEGYLTWGILYKIDNTDLTKLDKIEDGYQRITVTIETAQEDSIAAEAYISEKITNRLVVSDSYKALVIAGAEEHNLPPLYISSLQQLLARPDKIPK